MRKLTYREYRKFKQSLVWCFEVFFGWRSIPVNKTFRHPLISNDREAGRCKGFIVGLEMASLNALHSKEDTIISSGYHLCYWLCVPCR